MTTEPHICDGNRPLLNRCIVSPCPTKTILTISTARLRRNPSQRTFTISPRCYKCDTEFHLCQSLQNKGLLAGQNENNEDLPCLRAGCQRHRWRMCALCDLCLLNTNLYRNKVGTQNSTTHVSEHAVRERLSTQIPQCPPGWMKVREMLASKHQDLAFIDMEFSASCRSKVFSIALVDATGALLLLYYATFW